MLPSMCVTLPILINGRAAVSGLPRPPTLRSAGTAFRSLHGQVGREPTPSHRQPVTTSERRHPVLPFIPGGTALYKTTTWGLVHDIAHGRLSWILKLKRTVRIVGEDATVNFRCVAKAIAMKSNGTPARVEKTGYIQPLIQIFNISAELRSDGVDQIVHLREVAQRKPLHESVIRMVAVVERPADLH